MRHPPRPSAWIAGAAVLLLLAACSTPQRHRWLTFFFDGVPPLPGEAPPAAAPAVTNAPPARPPRPPPPPAPVAFVHEPYREKECRVCHTSNRSEKMKGPMTTVCFACHDDFLAGAAFRHEPAEAGDCMACHLPHRSTFPHLLARSGDALCLDCHDAGEMKESAAHADNGARTCLDCHTPHVSKRKGLLK